MTNYDAMERAVGAFYEKIQDDIKLVLETVEAVNIKVNNLPTRDEFNDLRSEVITIKHALTATNEDLRVHGKQIASLESAIHDC